MRAIEVSIEGGSISGNGIINVTRGDSFSIKVKEVEFNAEGTPLILEPGDTLYFGLMEPHQPFENALIRKAEEIQAGYEGEITFDFSSEMTEFLLPGAYYYSIKAKRDGVPNECVRTLRKKTRINILD